MYNSTKISRSISLPVKPQHIEPKSLKRSNEKEKVYSENSMQYFVYEEDEFNDDENYDISVDNDDKISLNINTENVNLKRNPNQEINTEKIQYINKNYQRRRRHSSDGGKNDTLINKKSDITPTNYDDTDSDIDINFIDDSEECNTVGNDHKNCQKKFMNKNQSTSSGIKNKIINENYAVPGTSGTDQSNIIKQRYRKDKRRTSNTRKASSVGLGERRGSQGWFGSTIEVNKQEDTNDSASDDDEFGGIVEDRFIRKSISRNINRRLIRKNGYQNVSFKNIPKRSLKYWKDLITTLIELEWSYVLSIFVIIFVGSWILFAVLWYLIAKAHGDLDFDPLTKQRIGEGKKPCVHGAYDMTAMFIHSLELQTTIGFGEKYPTEECPEGVFLFVFQIISSIAFEGAIVAVVYAKMAKPVKLLSKFTFSKTACIHLRDGKFCFIFRVCDPREQKCIGTKIRAYLVADATTPEGETMKVNTELKIEGDGTGIITWPETICHVINKNSPFYKFTAIDFHTKNFEVFISLVGHSPLTGQSTESRTSYLPHEILWGQRFPNIIDYSQMKQSYVVDYDNFHTTIAANIPFKSAAHLEKLKL
ncbi:ATP-sensitive inward rectifier potassium channel 1 [Condylostylus longicornis]|uniref:ATP-sensitive inward rectifier potassium channel 1 n=1 Tax=Condylostylus longicornis TaxID=2530218 RepID=UPI00244DC9B8|nr:ATP-sensitive inward rectifier potassium channel 1 [Condylostylus longicornis]